MGETRDLFMDQDPLPEGRGEGSEPPFSEHPRMLEAALQARVSSHLTLTASLEAECSQPSPASRKTVLCPQLPRSPLARPSPHPPPTTGQTWRHRVPLPLRKAVTPSHTVPKGAIPSEPLMYIASCEEDVL